MQRSVLAFALGLGILGASSGLAAAADYLVVNSSDVSLTKGATVKGGSEVKLAPGGTLVLISSTGQMVKLVGNGSGVRVPDGGNTQATPMFAQLQTMLVRSPPSRRAFGAMRGPACPTLAELKDLDAIVAADQIPACQVISRQALEAYVSADSAGAPAEPAKP